jgi:hypothetical protein
MKSEFFTELQTFNFLFDGEREGEEGESKTKREVL